jgi:hypothetical protein
MQDVVLATAEADRDSAIAEAASLRRELGLLRQRIERAEYRPCPPPEFRGCPSRHAYTDTIETTHVHMRT